MIRINPANLLKVALQETGFVRRGSAFFRVWGDGVLQVLKFERQRGDRVYDLSVGVFSMYGRLYPEWFTSSGCIPRASIASFIAFVLWTIIFLQIVSQRLTMGNFSMMDFLLWLNQNSGYGTKMESVGNTISLMNSKYIS